MSATGQSEHSDLVPGLYHIFVVFSGHGFDGKRLTADAKGHATIAPPSAHPDPAQQWRVTSVDGARDIVTIERPIHDPPLEEIYLSYEGAHDDHPPKEHTPVVVNDFKTEWIRAIGPGFTNIIRVKNSRLAISISDAHAPRRRDLPLILDDKSALKWIFELVSPHVE